MACAAFCLIDFHRDMETPNRKAECSRAAWRSRDSESPADCAHRLVVEGLDEVLDRHGVSRSHEPDLQIDSIKSRHPKRRKSRRDHLVCQCEQCRVRPDHLPLIIADHTVGRRVDPVLHQAGLLLEKIEIFTWTSEGQT